MMLSESSHPSVAVLEMTLDDCVRWMVVEVDTRKFDALTHMGKMKMNQRTSDYCVR